MNYHVATFLCALAIVLGLAGCSDAPKLMPTPNIYSRGDIDPFPSVPPALQSNKVDVIYLTDRVPEATKAGPIEYGYKRSRFVAFGISQMQIGPDDLTWAQLVEASLTKVRKAELEVKLTKTTELGRFSPTPPSLVIEPNSPEADIVKSAQLAAEAEFKRVLAAQLERTRIKEVYLFVHGFNNTFMDSVTTIAELWHFFGREGVPIAYTWPAGSKGLLRGYTYDRESSEFTVYHLKQALRLIASCPEVQKVHIIGHSRGTDVVMSAIRELHLEISGSGKSTREVMKFGTLVLAAPDMDFDVVMQRISTAQLARVPEHSVLYICSKDKALGVSNWLFGGSFRLGDIESDVFTPGEIAAMRKNKSPEVIDARISNPGAFGHDYFHSNPAVSSDLILLMRYQFVAGAANGRPLGVSKAGFYQIHDDYPGPPPADKKEPE